MVTVDFVDLAIAAVVAILGAFIADRFMEKARAIPIGLIIGAVVGLLLAQTAVKGWSQADLTGAHSATPPTSSSGPASSSTASPSPASSSTASPSPLSTPSVTGSRPTPANPEAEQSWTVDAGTSDASDAKPVKGRVISRFWHYEGTFGDVQMHASYATAPETSGADCGNPYVRYLVDGVPRGTYRIETYIPEVNDAAHRVEYGDSVVDQSSHLGEWVSLGTIESSQSVPGSQALEISVAQEWKGEQQPDGCERTGRTVAFGPVRFTLQE